MSEHRPIYGANTAVLSDFPEPVRATLHLIEKNPSNEAALILLQCAASAAHPDYLFSLAMLSALPIEYKEAALELIEHSLNRHAGSWAAAARELQLDRANLQRLAKRLGVERG